MEKEFISEVHDNYRRPEYSPEKKVYLFNYLDEESQELWRKKLYEMACKNETD
jgi:hypothetical protein